MGKLASLVFLVVICTTSLYAAAVTRPPTSLSDDELSQRRGTEQEAEVLPTPALTFSRPHYIECQSSAECGVGNCCVLGMGRFSIPTCQGMQDTNASCRPFGHRHFNSTVSYPDGANVQLTDVYRLFCPCAVGLGCDLETSTCQDDSYIYNTLLV